MAQRRRRRPSLPPFTDFAQLPIILKLLDMSRLYRLSVPTIRRRLRAGTFLPRPSGMDESGQPFWLKADVLRDLEQPRLDCRPSGRRTLTH